MLIISGKVIIIAPRLFFYFTLIFVEFCFENASLQPKIQKKNNIPDEILTQI